MIKTPELEHFPFSKWPFLEHLLTPANALPKHNAPALHSKRFVHPPSNPNHRTGHRFPPLPKALAAKTHGKHAASDPCRADCVWYGAPSPAFPCEAPGLLQNANPQAMAGSAFSETISPAAAHYLWQLFLDPKWVLKPCCQLPSCHPTIL